MNYIIGDIHSSVDKLNLILSLLHLKSNDTLIFLGDYIDKNTHTQETVARLKQLQKNYTCIFIKGNHDFVWERYLLYGETDRQDYLLRYGGVETLKQFHDHPKELIQRNDITKIKKYLSDYIALIHTMRDYHIVGPYLALHAGLTKDQYNQDPLKFTEKNYFLRPHDIHLDKCYLDKYMLVAGHTFLNESPMKSKGYINLDLGAGYDKYLAVLCVEQKIIFRSDGEKFYLDDIPEFRHDSLNFIYE